jgi:flagellar hook-associated protein 1
VSQTLFNIGRSSLLAYQQAINVTGQNVSNLQNPDYTRQNPVIATNILNNATNINKDMAMGVSMTDVKRLRDELLNGYYRTENNTASQLSATSSLYTQVEFMFNELGDFKLGDTISQFWQSWQALQESPEDLSLRKNITQVGGFVADSINTKNDQLVNLRDNINQDVNYEISQVNNMLEQLSDVNKNLTKSWIETSTERNQLMDRKDALLDSLMSEMNFQAVTSPDQSVNLYLNGTPMFYKDQFRTIITDNTGALKLSTGEDITLKGGKLNGYIDMRDNILKKYQDELDSFAKNLIDNVNKIHRNGYAQDGTAGVDFFAGNSAATIAISTAMANPEKVASSLATLTSDMAVNAAPSIVDAAQSITGQAANFSVTPDDAAGNGSFRINGADILWDSSMSIQDIVDKINNYTPAVPGGPLPGIKATWNSELQQLELERDPTVDTTPPTAGITLGDPTDPAYAEAGNFTTFMHIDTAVLNKNAESSGENALCISQLWHRKVVSDPANPAAPASWTLNEEYAGLANEVAKDKNLIDNLATNKQRLVDNIKTRREAEGTVSIDEEMINIMKFQQAYGASSKLITFADEMLDTLINRTGTVGR